MTRLFIILGLVAALAVLATVEQVYIDRTYKHMIHETNVLLGVVAATPENEDKEAFFSENIKNRVDSLHKYWMKRERKMSIVTRYMELSYISDALIYAQNFIHHHNKEEASAGLERLRYLVTSYSEIYGINFTNIL